MSRQASSCARSRTGQMRDDVMLDTAAAQLRLAALAQIDIALVRSSGIDGVAWQVDLPNDA